MTLSIRGLAFSSSVSVTHSTKLLCNICANHLALSFSDTLRCRSIGSDYHGLVRTPNWNKESKTLYGERLQPWRKRPADLGLPSEVSSCLKRASRVPARLSWTRYHYRS